jgi:hypothetical protein
MTGMTNDLITWLRAQLDDDEQATLASSERDWRPDGANSCQVYVRRPDGSNRTIAWCANGYEDDFANSLHIARHDPAWMLAEVNAKRRILDLHTGVHDCPEMRTGVYPADRPAAAAYGKPGERWAYPSTEHFDADEFCPTARALTLPYADRAGYRDEWRP